MAAPQHSPQHSPQQHSPLRRSPVRRSPLRRLLGLLSTLLVAGFLVTGFAGTAHAEEGYRYWNYFHLENSEWAFSQVGPAGYQPEDGAVEAYRFGASGSSDTDGIPPRADLSEVNFETICTDQEAAADQKRVAVIVDYGTEADAEGSTPPAPRADCAVVPAEANGQQVLDAVAEVRSEDGLTCALDGYPAQGCGVPVPDVAAAEEQPVAFELPSTDTPAEVGADEAGQPASEETSDLLWPLIGVGLVVVVIASAALALSRRNRSA